jgi:D-psicose/D-tagatose/L-ribulose 3-epimerase
MPLGASTFIWVSPFSNGTFDLVDKVARPGFDLIEICVEDPATIDPTAIRRRLGDAGTGATACGAFGPTAT